VYGKEITYSSALTSYVLDLEVKTLNAVWISKLNVSNFMFMWPWIVTNFFIIKPTRCTNFPHLLRYEILHVSCSSSVHSKCLFTVHSALVYVINVWRQLSSRTRSLQWINYWWWAEELPETCRDSCPNKFAKLVHLVGFIIKKIHVSSFLNF
jgi:hypothetical protein